MKTIEDCILWYCQGNYHLEFTHDDLPKIIEHIKELVCREIRHGAEHVDDAVSIVEGLK